MKKIALLLLWLALCSGKLWGQEIPDCNYDPYRHKEWRESSFKEYESLFQMYLTYSCDENIFQKMVNEFQKTKDIQFLESIYTFHSCPKIVDFLRNIIDSSSNEAARCKAIVELSSRFQSSEIPFLQNHLKKDISIEEQLAVARALFTLGETTQSMEIFERYCYEMDEMGYDCFFNYQFTENEDAAIRYFNHFFNKPHCKMEAACELARLGVVDKTFPYFIELLKTNAEVPSTYALVGLSAIATDEAFEMIKLQTKNKVSSISQSAKQIIAFIIKERREKCGK